MPHIIHKKEGHKVKNLNLKFNIDCSLPVEDKVIILTDFKEYL